MTRMRRRQRETKTKRLITNQGGQWRSHRLELFFWDRNRPAFFWFVGKYKAGELGLIWNRCFVLAELFWTATCRDNFERRVCFACEINLCWNVCFVLFLESWLCMICCRERSFDHLRIQVWICQESFCHRDETGDSMFCLVLHHLSVGVRDRWEPVTTDAHFVWNLLSALV